MKIFKAILGMLAILIVGAQTFRHIYVYSFGPRGSVLDQFDTTSQKIAESKSIDELIALYKETLQKVKEEDAAHPPNPEGGYDYSRNEREPYKSEILLKNAIEEWESHQRQLRELHFFWWAGFACIVIGAIAYLRINQWLGLSFFVLGYSEMIWATCPSFGTFGYPIEFERLLAWKVVYSIAASIFVLLAWFGEMRRSK